MQPQPARPPKTERHPWALLFHWLFKVAAIFFYLFSSLFTSNFVITFVVSVVLVALDFWVVKNVTGRRLVALRWWNEANDSGSAWRFESAPEGTRIIIKQEKTLFWAGLFANFSVWGFLIFTALVGGHFDYVVIPVFGCLLGTSNMVGYLKCSQEAGEQLQAYTSSFMQQAATRAVSNAMTSSRV